LKLQTLVFGAGAIGTYIGGSLVLAGHPVVFLERLDVVNELRVRGLLLALPDGEAHIPSLRLASSIEEAIAQGPYDVAIFALKSYDTRAALESLAPHRQILPPILCLQNGVDNEIALAAVLGEDKVIAGTVTSSIGRRAAGDIILERKRGMGVAAGHPLSPSLAAALDIAGLNAHLYHKATDMKWSKMLTNLLANASSAILAMSPAEIFAHPGLYRLEIAQLRETLAVMSALGIHPVDLPATPVRLLAFAIRSLPLAISRPLLRRSVGRGRGGKMPSFYIDLNSGLGKSEVDYLNGAVVRYGQQLGLPTPANKLLNATLLALTNGDLSRETFARHPESLLTPFKS
jgi:2-dehydropantoate 2-reductase